MAVVENQQPKYERDHQPAQFTLKEIREAVPPHLWQRSTLKSFLYLFADLFLVGCIAYAASFIDAIPSTLLRYALWIFYWIVQGTVATGVWVIGHECGHYAFSDSKLVNNAVGYVLHTLLLVPYYSWKISHAGHHGATGHMTKDQVFVPPTRSQMGLPPRPASADTEVMTAAPISDKAPHHSPLEEAIEETPLVSLVKLLGIFVLGWPIYLITNKSGQHPKAWSSHFDPFAKFFLPSHTDDVIKSDVGIAAMIAVLCAAGRVFGTAAVLKYYLVPYLVVNFWLVIITLLQHTAPYLPHYRDTVWTFARGAALTIDRDYGWLLNTLHHHIADSHVAHHFFCTMPHYNAVKATPYIKEALGKYYYKDDTPFLKAAWDAQRKCLFVEDEGDVVFWKTK